MKRYIVSTVLIALSFGLFAQNQVDALRYSWLNPSGTARYNSMGGAFGSLGGDFGAISQNPAALGVFRRSEVTFTPGIMYTQTDAAYIDKKSSDFTYNMNIGNLGYVGTMLFESKGNALKSLSFGFGYNQLSNFNQCIKIEGIIENNSMAQYFAATSDGYKPENLGDFYGWPAYYTYLIDPANADSTSYISNIGSFGQEQKENIQRSGNVGEYVLSMGMNFDHTLYAGASFGIQQVDFEQSIFYAENDVNDVIDNFNSFTYAETLKTSGTGYNLKMGVIYRPLDWLRTSVALHTPTFYNLHDEYSTYFSSQWDSTWMSNTKESPLGLYNYKLTSPFRAQAGLATVLFNSTILSVDYEYANYGISKLRASDYAFDDENKIIADYYTGTHNIKAGAEYRIGMVAFRLGWAYYDSPYKDDNYNSDASFMQYSGGIGVRNESFFFDLGYVYQDRSEKYFLYESPAVSSPVANMDIQRHAVMATIGIRF
ncbi:MAG: OmpP1/FadL family transporter [Bacteroidales bacterium]